jgi:hypothetical protein
MNLMRSPYLSALAVTFALSSPAVADTFEISGTHWLSEGTEFPSVCMTFEPNGTLSFKGGFVWYNPSRWNKVTGTAELIEIRLGGKRAFPAAVAEEQLKHEPNGSLASFNARRRLLVYRIGFGNVPLLFNGLLFEPSERCGDALYLPEDHKRE